MKEYLLDLMIDIFPQEHETHHLQWRKVLELIPSHGDVQLLCPLLVFFGVECDLLDCPVD